MRAALGLRARRYVADDTPPSSVVYAAVRADYATELVDLLLAHGAEPGIPGPDGRLPHQLATSQGRTDLAGLLRRYGASDDAGDADRFLSACLRPDHVGVQRQLARDPGLPGRLH